MVLYRMIYGLVIKFNFLGILLGLLMVLIFVVIIGSFLLKLNHILGLLKIWLVR